MPKHSIIYCTRGGESSKTCSQTMEKTDVNDRKIQWEQGIGRRLSSKLVLCMSQNTPEKILKISKGTLKSIQLQKILVKMPDIENVEKEKKKTIRKPSKVWARRKSQGESKSLCKMSLFITVRSY